MDSGTAFTKGVDMLLWQMLPGETRVALINFQWSKYHTKLALFAKPAPEQPTIVMDKATEEAMHEETNKFMSQAASHTKREPGW
jgi:GH25 family lysozyme M1 (1,4-beta-N-acetylmuramidase)